MEKNKFIEELFYELSCQLGKEFEMKQKRVWKNNGVSYEGLVIEKLEEDVGVESYTEAVKGAASDSFKRACFNIGIGRELYTAPFIWIPSDKVSIAEGDGKLKVRDSFNVSYISYDENGKVIKSLEIRNQKNEIVCQFNMGNKVSKQASQTANKNQISDYRMGKLYDEMKRTGVTEQQIVERFHVSLANLTERDYKRIMSALKNTDTRAA